MCYHNNGIWRVWLKLNTTGCNVSSWSKLISQCTFIKNDIIQKYKELRSIYELYFYLYNWHPWPQRVLIVRWWSSDPGANSKEPIDHITMVINLHFEPSASMSYLIPYPPPRPAPTHPLTMPIPTIPTPPLCPWYLCIPNPTTTSSPSGTSPPFLSWACTMYSHTTPSICGAGVIA